MTKAATFLFLLSFTFSLFSQSKANLPTDTTSLFAGSGKCLACHINNNAGVLTSGYEYLTPANHWRSSMMANASKDPLWRAVVSEEVSKFPELAHTIETTCTRCHAPMGNVQALHEGSKHYSVEEMKKSRVANDGVSCTTCHQIQPSNMGAPSSYSGGFEIKPGKVIFGPYTDPLQGPMLNTIGFEASYSPHMNNSELCATCHTLFTPYLDNNNKIAGIFPEQTPYIEWKNSDYSKNQTQCQSCHMPPVHDSTDISTTPPWHKVKRIPFWRHTFVGPNVWMGKILRENNDTLRLTATAAQFDSTIDRAKNFLTDKAVTLDLASALSGDTIISKIKIVNLSGHKLPAGIPYRRVWLHYTIKDETGKLVFESGGWDDAGNITGSTEKFQDHYNVITSPAQTQIYEGVFQDVDKELTYTLLRAASYKKDNRLPPAGFTTGHVSYDTVKITGSAAVDPDFNREGKSEGTGADIITYKFPVKSKGAFTVSVEAVYQSIPPSLVKNLAKYDTPDINEFIRLYNSSDNKPFIMKSVSTNIKL